jgi:peptidoglycan/xylan/chitin deacetylase (PgdA/CDA1 family)
MVTLMKEAGVTATFFLNTRSLVEADQGPWDEHVE